MLKDFKIRSKKDVKDFIHYLINDLRINLHPDDNFKDYIIGSNGERAFTDEEADKLNMLMDLCFVYAKNNIYKICQKEHSRLNRDI